MNGEFLFAYTSNGLYILDPLNASVILWNNEFSITEAHVINNEIYLITDSGKFHCLTLCTIDSLIVSLYDRKLYQDCLQVSSTFRSRILKVLANDDDDNDDNSENPDSIPNRQNSDFFDLEQKAENFAIREILPLVSILRSSLHQPKKLESRIVLVNSGSSKSSPEPSGSFKGSPEILEKQDNEDDLICNYLETTSEEIVVRTEREKKREEKTDRKENVLHETMCVLQMELKSLHRLVESLKFTNDNEEEIEQILIKVADMIKEIKNR